MDKWEPIIKTASIFIMTHALPTPALANQSNLKRYFTLSSEIFRKGLNSNEGLSFFTSSMIQL